MPFVFEHTENVRLLEESYRVLFDGEKMPMPDEVGGLMVDMNHTNGICSTLLREKSYK